VRAFSTIRTHIAPAALHVYFLCILLDTLVHATMVLLISLKAPILAQLVIADLHTVTLYTSLETAGPPALPLVHDCAPMPFVPLRFQGRPG
jgi:hypothetical protein